MVERARPPARLAGIDGIRGVALLGMLAWHAEVEWVKGGFARMTIFFVLAGFLATRSIERLRERGDARPFLSFWRRRVFRLLPMTLLGVAWAVAVTAAIGGSRARQSVGGDVLSVLGSVSNWRFILDGRPYGALFEAPNAFQHYWSLSVEEQSFLLLPLVLVVARTFANRRWRMVGAVAVLAVAYAEIPLLVAHTEDAAYYGTHVRFGEFLAGVALALALAGRDPQQERVPVRRAWDAAGLASLVLLLGVMLVLGRDHAWLYRGGMGLFALPAAFLIGAVDRGAPLVSRVVGLRPLAALGRWALSVYVLHWPLFLLLNRAAPRFGVTGGGLEAIKVAAAVVVGAVAYRLVEHPLMAARDTRQQADGPVRLARWWSRDRVAGPVVAAGAVACLVAALAVPQRDPVINLEAAIGQGTAPLSASEADDILAGVTPPDLPVYRNPDNMAVALFGGSGALMLALGASRWTDQQPTVEAIPGYSPLSCGLLTRGERRGEPGRSPNRDDRPERPPEECLDWTRRWPAVVKKNRIDVAVVVSSTLDLVDWRLDADPESEWRSVGDPLMDSVLTRAMHVAADALYAGGAREVVFLTAIEPPQSTDHDDRGRRAAAYNDLMRRVVESRDDVRLVDYGAWTAQLDPDDFDRWLPDGVHTTHETAPELWDGWLGETLESAVPLIPHRPTT